MYNPQMASLCECYQLGQQPHLSPPAIGLKSGAILTHSLSSIPCIDIGANYPCSVNLHMQKTPDEVKDLTSGAIHTYEMGTTMEQPRQ